MSQRRFHTDKRLSENFTEQGLHSLTGQSSHEWGRYVLKELLDNALEAVEDTGATPEINVQVEFVEYAGYGHDEVVGRVAVADNGPGISEERLERIFKDVAEFGGTKRHYRLPTRGNQGNALMTVLGIQNLCGRPLELETQGQRYHVTVTEDPLSGKPEIELSCIESGLDREGTKIAVDFSGQAGGYTGSTQELETLAGFVALNPHAGFTVETERDGEVETVEYPAASDPTGSRFTLSKNATTGKATWFDSDGFEERLRADARAAPEMTVDEFVQEFQGVSSRGKRADVFERFGEEHTDTTVAELVRRDDLPAPSTLRDCMAAETRTYSESGLEGTIGSVGKDLQTGLVHYLRNQNDLGPVEDMTDSLSALGADFDAPEGMAIYYGAGGIGGMVSDKITPYYFELAAIPMPDETAQSTLQFGINQSVAYSNPNFTLNVKHTNGEQRHYGITAAFEETDHPYYILANLTCPNIDFKDKGKQQFDTEPFADTVAEVVGKAIRKIERDHRPRLNKLRNEPEPEDPKLSNKAPHGFIKDFIYSNFENVYGRATEGGRYTITMRQFYYAMNELFEKETARLGYKYKNSATPENKKRLELTAGYFRGVVGDYETEELGKRVILRDARGFFAEPHSNEIVDLDTSEVRGYEPPEGEFNNLLFIEKTGYFTLLHKEFELTKKYDIGLINSKGFAVNAARDLIEKIQRQRDATLYVLSDFDIAGLGIAEDATNSDDLSAVAQFDAERLGVTHADIDEYGLTPEPTNYNEKQITELMNRVEAGEVTPEAAELLRANGGQRVEINTFTPADLKDYLTDKFEAAGIEKYHPDKDELSDPEETREEAIDLAIGRWIRNQAGDELKESVEDAVGEDITSRDEIHDRVVDELTDKPPEGWEDIEKDAHDDIAKKVREEAREYLAGASATVELP